MHDWALSQRNNMRFSTLKCKALTVTRKKTPIGFDYSLDDLVPRVLRLFWSADERQERL